MSDGDSGPKLYQVSYSKRVHRMLSALARQARERGDGGRFLGAFKEFHHRLCVYPQFEDPLADLQMEVGQIRIGIVSPLAMRYGVLEDRRLMIVGAIPVLLPKANVIE